MHPLVQTMFIMGTAFTAVGLVVATRELRLIRNLLSTREILFESQPSASAKLSRSMGASAGGHAIFVFRQGQWALEEDLSRPGYEAVPPAIAGTFEGQVVKKESALSRRG